MNIFKKSMLVASLGLIVMASTASAHLVSVGWKDNGNGTVTVWGEHWHGDLSAPSSDNGGVMIDGITFQWTGFQNNTDRDDMIGDGTLTGYAVEPINGPAEYMDWMFTDPLVVGNGVHTIFTGTNCCIDQMNGPAQFTFTGITSVPPGTNPGQPVPEPASLVLFGLGAAGLALLRRRKNGADA